MEWDAWNWGRVAEMWLRKSRLDFSGVRCLEIGGRNGALASWLAGMGAAVLSVDVALKQEMQLVFPDHGCAKVVYGDIFSLPDGLECDLIVFKSVLGAIGGRGGLVSQKQAIRIMHEHLRPGGELWFAENLTGSPMHRLARRLFIPWETAWRYGTMTEFSGFLSPFLTYHLSPYGFAGAFGRTERQRRMLGRLDEAGLERLVPRHWRYILGGVAYA